MGNKIDGYRFHCFTRKVAQIDLYGDVNFFFSSEGLQIYYDFRRSAGNAVSYL